jgi:hypothetical protein
MRGAIWGGILLAVSAGLLILAWPRTVVLSLTDLRREQEVYCARMAEGEEVVLRFIHSVNKRPVFDTLRAGPDHVVIVKSRFDAFGAGMPEASTDQGTFRVLPDGWLEWTINRRMPEVVVRVGRVADHTLLIEGREVPLAGLAEPGAPIAFTGQLRSLVGLWKGRCVR